MFVYAFVYGIVFTWYYQIKIYSYSLCSIIANVSVNDTNKMNGQYKNRSFHLIFLFVSAKAISDSSSPDQTIDLSVFIFGPQTVSVEFFLKQLMIHSIFFFFKKIKAHVQICDYLNEKWHSLTFNWMRFFSFLFFFFFSRALDTYIESRKIVGNLYLVCGLFYQCNCMCVCVLGYSVYHSYLVHSINVMSKFITCIDRP